MTHRDGLPRLSARSAWRGDAGHRKPCGTPSESLGKPPFRSRKRTAGGRRQASTMSRIACGFPPTRRIACPISMGHYQRSLVLEDGIENERSAPRPGGRLGRIALGLLRPRRRPLHRSLRRRLRLRRERPLRAAQPRPPQARAPRARAPRSAPPRIPLPRLVTPASVRSAG